MQYAYRQQCFQTEELQSKAIYKEHKSLIPFGFKVYSQNDEDGILQEIFKRIGV